MATPITTSHIKYAILQEEDEGETSEEGSEIIIITPIHSDREYDDTSVLNIVLTSDNNTGDSNHHHPPPPSSSTHLHYLTNNNNNNNNDDDDDDSSCVSTPTYASYTSTLAPPPPYEGAEAPLQPNGITTPSNLAESGSQDGQDLFTVMMMDYLRNKMSQRHGAIHQQNTLGGQCLPSYNVATDLPSYEEAERAKQEEMLRAVQTDSVHEQQDEERNSVETTEHLTSMAIGTDWTFLYTFILSFLFNWIGFLLSLCITSTVSGRCGALSGLGLSVVKWVAIVKHSKWASGFAEEESWLWWSLMICGFLLFIRGCVQYVHIKYEWKKIAGRLQQFYFF